jgi:hypothetical protein
VNLRCFGEPLDRGETFVPAGRDLHHLSLGLIESLVAYGEARLAARASRLHETRALKDE